MAVRKIAMVVNLRQNKNEAAEHFGKWYPEVDTKTPLDLKGFCAHMTEHGKLADYQMVVLVVQQVVECMKELVLQGQPVKLEGLGTFGPSLESKKQLGAGGYGRRSGLAHRGRPHELHPREHQGREADLASPEGRVRVRCGLCRRERQADRQRQGKALPEQDPDCVHPLASQWQWFEHECNATLSRRESHESNEWW